MSVTGKNEENSKDLSKESAAQTRVDDVEVLLSVSKLGSEPGLPV